MMDEKVLRVLSELSSFDRLSEVAFYSALRRLSPEVAAVPIYENIWNFDGGPIGAAEFPDGLESRRQPFKEVGGGGRTPERRVSTIQPLFQLATREMRYADELRSLIQPAALEAMSTQAEPAEVLGRPHIQVIQFMWKAVAIALVMEGNWLHSRTAASLPESDAPLLPSSGHGSRGI
jgi:hypothetical protein